MTPNAQQKGSAPNIGAGANFAYQRASSWLDSQPRLANLYCTAHFLVVLATALKGRCSAPSPSTWLFLFFVTDKGPIDSHAMTNRARTPRL
jgi:hypothetical protein